MSGGGGGVIIIHKMVESGQFDSADAAELQAIADRSVTHCSLKDAWRVCRILWKRIRKG